MTSEDANENCARVVVRIQGKPLLPHWSLKLKFMLHASLASR